jgi:hypothetical protein
MLIEPTTITVCLAIKTIAVSIAHLLLDAFFIGFGVARHVTLCHHWSANILDRSVMVGLPKWRHVEHLFEGGHITLLM